MNILRVGLVAFATATAAASTGIDARAQGISPPQGFFGVEQARRGMASFTTHCARCHTLGASEASGVQLPLAGGSVLRKWRTAGDLYSRIRRTMPADNVGGLTNANYLDILAYLLQANGLPAGRALTPDPAALHERLLGGESTPAGLANDVSMGRFYTAAQAARGEGYFQGHCVMCHATSPDGTLTAAQRAAGFKGSMYGTQDRVWPIGGGEPRLRRWGTVYNLFNRVRAMPVHDTGALSTGAYVDMTAYLLQLYGAPAGPEELRYSVNAMRSMALDEPGFEKLFNGRDFTGIRFVLGANCAPRPAGCGQTEPGDAFRVEDGAMTTSGAPIGYWYADRKFLDFTLRADYRYTRPAGLEREDEFNGNSGYLLFITRHGVWPKSIEVQGSNRGVMGGFALDGVAKVAVDNDARTRALRPLGEWNSFEIVSSNNTVRTFLNGTPIGTFTEHEFKEPGYIGFQSEGAQLQWRNIRIRPE